LLSLSKGKLSLKNIDFFWIALAIKSSFFFNFTAYFFYFPESLFYVGRFLETAILRFRFLTDVIFLQILH